LIPFLKNGEILMKFLPVAFVAFSFVATGTLPTTVYAAGGSGGDDSGSAPSKPKKKRLKKCKKKGQVYSIWRRKCVTPKKSELSDDNIFRAGRMLAFDGRYGEAIEVLTLASDLNSPKILNYLGYAHRKAGRIDVGLGYYKQALAIDPDYTLVREYMGEAFLERKNFKAAEYQLSEIAKRCGFACPEYTLLSSAIIDVKAGRPISEASKNWD
jgi:hypothetical protein